MRRRLVAVNAIPTTLVSGWCRMTRSRTDSTVTYGASRKKLIPTAFWARASEVSEWVREPVNRQITITLAKPSTPEERAHPRSAIEPAATPAAIPSRPSTVIHPKLNHDSQRTWRAARCHAALRSNEREEGSSTRKIFERWLRDRGLTLRPAMEVASTEAVKQVVAAGLGVSVVSGATIQLELKAGVLASPPTDGFPINRRIDVVLQRNRRPMPTTVAFLEILLGPKPASILARAAAALAGAKNRESG